MRQLFIAIIILVLLCSAHAYSKDAIYIDKKYGFSIEYPEQYRVLKNYKNAPLVILFPVKKLFSLFNSNVAITVTTARPSKKSLEDIVDIYFKYDKTVSDRKEVSINRIKFISITQTQKKSLWFFKLNIKLHHLIAVRKKRIYTITYSADTNVYDKYAKEAEKIMRSIRFL